MGFLKLRNRQSAKGALVHIGLHLHKRNLSKYCNTMTYDTEDDICAFYSDMAGPLWQLGRGFIYNVSLNATFTLSFRKFCISVPCRLYFYASHVRGDVKK